MHRYLTEGLPGTGGVIKENPEDFQVTEIPLYLPCGEGEHSYVEIEKRGITTLEAIRRLARFAAVTEREIGYAGMKDAGGITRQTVSIPRVAPERFLNASIPGINVISVVRHRNKLKLGHLAGNRFRIRVGEVGRDALEKAEDILSVLRKRGVPNFFGLQRYGVQGNYPLVGRALLRGDYKAVVDGIMGDPQAVQDERWKNAIAAYLQGDIAKSLESLPGYCRTERDILTRLARQPDAYEKALHAVNLRLRRLYLSAYQSVLFDRVLDERLDEFDKVLEGDLAYKHDNGACFLVEDASVEAERAEIFEISPSGPLFGCKMKLPRGIPLEKEKSVLEEEGIALEDFSLPGGLRMEGERRPLRIRLKDPVAEMDDAALVLEFSLPRGAYATSVLKEIMKCRQGEPA
jgi:tRNA pseudouridine13 synthase